MFARCWREILHPAHKNEILLWLKWCNVFVMNKWLCMQATKLRRPERETVRRQFSSSCGSFIDYSWGSSSKTDGEPFLSSSSRWLAHGFDYIISWELICKSLSCWRHTSLFSILRALSGFPGLNQNICWPFWDPLFLPDTFLTLRSCAVGFHKASVFKKTLNPFEYIGRLLHANVNS